MLAAYLRLIYFQSGLPWDLLVMVLLIENSGAITPEFFAAYIEITIIFNNIVLSKKIIFLNMKP